MAAAADYHADDDEFDEYNPHPYGGGYDISATCGAPLPPSPSTCYPVSSPATPPPSPRPPLRCCLRLRLRLVLLRRRRLRPRSLGRFRPSRRSLPRRRCRWRSRTTGPSRTTTGMRGYWRQWMRGLDYLFGHSDGYGERRIGVDRHGVPVYANKKGGVEDAVVVEVAPPAIGNVEWHDGGEVPDQSNRLSWYDMQKRILWNLVNVEIWQAYFYLPSILNKHKFMSSLMLMRLSPYIKICRATGMCFLKMLPKSLNRVMIPTI